MAAYLSAPIETRHLAARQSMEEFDQGQANARSSQPIAPSAAEAPPSDLRQIADQLAQQHQDWAKRRPADYKVPYQALKVDPLPHAPEAERARYKRGQSSCWAGSGGAIIWAAARIDAVNARLTGPGSTMGECKSFRV